MSPRPTPASRRHERGHICGPARTPRQARGDGRYRSSAGAARDDLQVRARDARINVVTHEMIEREALIYAALAGMLGMLTSDDRPERLTNQSYRAGSLNAAMSPYRGSTSCWRRRKPDRSRSATSTDVSRSSQTTGAIGPSDWCWRETWRSWQTGSPSSTDWNRPHPSAQRRCQDASPYSWPTSLNLPSVHA